MSIQRLPNWRVAFADAITRLRRRPMVWGASDCCLSSADLAHAICGQDLAAPLRGYSTPEGALKALRKLGHDSVESYLDSILPRCARPLAGDFVLIPQPPLDLVLIADGRGQAWGQGEAGLERTPIPANAKFWRL